MATILSANRSEVTLDGESIEGLQAITYKVDRSREDIPAIGTDERIGVDFGLKLVTGTLTVKSTNDTLNNNLASNTAFQIVANLRKGDLEKVVTFNECYLDDKQVGLDTNGVLVTTYTFTATSILEG
jgi:hypothetical protein